ncbi:MAG TPA: peptidase M48, partial [Chromatiaceae bacterium]|nr:peptidase M48 [Chromatiaceae bacterium]
PEPSWLRTHPPTGERVRRILAFQDPDAVPLFEQLQAAWQTPFQHAGLAMPKWHLTGLWH